MAAGSLTVALARAGEGGVLLTPSTLARPAGSQAAMGTDEFAMPQAGARSFTSSSLLASKASVYILSKVLSEAASVAADSEESFASMDKATEAAGIEMHADFDAGLGSGKPGGSSAELVLEGCSAATAADQGRGKDATDRQEGSENPTNEAWQGIAHDPCSLDPRLLEELTALRKKGTVIWKKNQDRHGHHKRYQMRRMARMREEQDSVHDGDDADAGVPWSRPIVPHRGASRRRSEHSRRAQRQVSPEKECV